MNKKGTGSNVIEPVPFIFKQFCFMSCLFFNNSGFDHNLDLSDVH
jgi:hypothetical protein